MYLQAVRFISTVLQVQHCLGASLYGFGGYQLHQFFHPKQSKHPKSPPKKRFLISAVRAILESVFNAKKKVLLQLLGNSD